MANEQISSIDWTKCFLCQSSKTKGLRCELQTHQKMASNLREFYELHELHYNLSWVGAFNDSKHFEQVLIKNKAQYHHTCTTNYNDSMLKRARNRLEKHSNREEPAEVTSPPCKRRSEVLSYDFGKPVCCFCKEADEEINLCAAGTYHASKTKADADHVIKLTQKWREMAKVVENDDLLKSLSVGDVTANEVYYHKPNIKPCLQKFKNEYDKRLNANIKRDDGHNLPWIKAYTLSKVFDYMCEKENDEPSSMFQVKSLENMYIETLSGYNIHYSSHVSNFAKLLLERYSELETRKLGKKLVIFFKSTADAILEDALDPTVFVASLRKIVLPLRKIMSQKENKFDGNFDEDSQNKSVPVQLLTLVSMLIDGPGMNNQISQSSLTISQLVLSNYKDKVKNSSADIHQRDNRQRETPVKIYFSLSLYAATRSKKLIHKYFKLGIGISYYRVMEITKGLSDSVIDEYAKTNVFAPRNLKSNLFTLIAKDNVDKNASSNTAVQHYHGISMTVMQFPSENSVGESRPSPIFHFTSNTPNKKVSPLPPSYVDIKPTFIPKRKNLYAPKCSYPVSLYDDISMFEQARDCEISWLETINDDFKLNRIPIDSWSKHHANQRRREPSMKDIHALLPLIPKPVHTLQNQLHCMNLIMRTINYINPSQTAVDVCDQPVYALTKEIQFRKPDEFGSEKYFSLMGGLHIELCLLNIHGELIKGSGLYEILDKNHLSIIGTGAILYANHIKQSRYCMQVALSATYMKLKEAAINDKSNLSPFQWLQERSEQNEMCNYWRLILELQIDILVFIRSIRESNFHLYVLSLKNLMKWFFSMDHYNYARWVTVHLFDLVNLHINCPDVYKAFSEGKFAFQKTLNQFSKMAVDQLHEQNNEIIKGTGGATHLLNRADPSGLVRWETCGMEVIRLVGEFENTMKKTTDAAGKHHEDSPSFQKQFSSDVKKVFDGMTINPFEQDKLTKLSNTNVVFPDQVHHDLKSLLFKGESQFSEFWEKRLIKGETPIDSVIPNNNFLLPGKFEEKNKESEKKLIYAEATLTKLRSAIQFREQLTKQLFSTELFGVAQSLAKSATKLYHGTKSDIMKRFPSMELSYSLNVNAALVIELSPIVQGQDVTRCENFLELSSILYQRISDLAQGYGRVDIITDRYFNGSLKEGLRESRGVGSFFEFTDTTKIPSNFQKDFLKVSYNKDHLYQYLGRKFIEIHSSDQILVVTYNDSVLTSANVEMDGIGYCTSEEADQRVVRHVLNVAKCGIWHDIVVKTSDTDVFILLLAFFPYIKEVCDSEIYCIYGAEAKYYHITSIVETLNTSVLKALPFFHAFSGCDTTSSFYKQSKVAMWDLWMKYPFYEQLTKVFQVLSTQPSEISSPQIDEIEKFLKYVYYTSFEVDSLDIQRMRQFEYNAAASLQSIPPSRNGLTEHIKRACFQGGWIWREAISNIDLPDPENWGWKLVDGKYHPKWQNSKPDIDVLDVCQVCSCKKAICRNCKCKKLGENCLPFCGCRRKCKRI